MYKYNSKDVLNMFRGGSLIYNAEQEVCTRLFSGNTPGFWYYPNDLSTMFQDAAGTIPVTAAGQPVGLLLDKSKDLSLGAELFIEADVTIAGQSSKLASNRYRVYCPDGIESSGVRLMGKFTAGKWYLVEYTIDSIAAVGDGILAESTLNQVVYKTAGRKRVYVIATNSNFYLKRAGVCDYTVSNITVREIKGNHAYQTTSALRPILRQTPILGSELVVNGTFNTGVTNWSTGNGSAITKVTNGGMLITATTAANSQAAQNMGIAAGKTVQASVTFKNKVGNTQPKIALWSSSTGDVGGAIASSTTVSGTLTFLAQVPVGFAGQVIVQTNNANIGNNIEISSVSVKEVVGYYADRNYLEFDGIDDFLQTNNIDFTGTDKVTVIAGVRKLSDVIQGSVVELGRGVFLETSGSFVVNAPASAGVAGYKTYVQGGSASNLVAETPATFPAPISNVLTMRADIANKISKLNVNGIDVSATTGSVLNGNFGNYPLYIGRRAGQYIPFNGHLYSLIGIGNLVSDADTVLLEKLIALKIGVTLNA